MKKILSINTLAALLMAGAAFTACSSEDTIIDEQPVVNPTQKTVTMTVKASKDEVAGTRGLSLDGKTLNAVWKTTDVIKVYKFNSWDEPVGTLSPTSNTTGDVTLRGEVTGVTEGTKLALFMGGGGEAFDYTGQKGVLLSSDDPVNSIESKYDYASAGITQSFYAHYVNDGNEDILTLSSDPQSYSEITASFTNDAAIVKFTLVQSDGKTPVNTTQLDISCEDIFIKSPNKKGLLSINHGTATNVFYVALRCDMKTSGSGTMTLTANEYTHERTMNYGNSGRNHFFQPGKYYEVTVRMTAHDWTTVDLSTDLSGYLVNGNLYLPKETVSESNKYIRLIGELPENVTCPIIIREGAIVKLDGVTIPKQDVYAAGISCLGDATLILSGTNNVTGGNYNNQFYSGVTVNSGNTLTIKGNGTLYATGGGLHAAGIGSSADYNNNPTSGVSEACGNIVIEGGVIYAEGGEGAPGIGAGSENCGTITITGGEVHAEAGPGETYSSSLYHAAAIGTNPWNTSCGAISITGGSVYAISDNAESVIGDATINQSSSKCESINIGSGSDRVIIYTGKTVAASYNNVYVKNFLKAGTVTIGSYPVKSDMMDSPMTSDNYTKHALITAIEGEFPESAFNRPPSQGATDWQQSWRLSIKRLR